MEILQKEDKLQQIVKLVGPDALPDTQRLILFVADIIKNAFLQQNAFDKIDMYSFPKKQIMMIKILMMIYEKGNSIIRKGAPLLKIRQLPILNRVMRMKSQIPNEEPAKLQELYFQVEQELNRLEQAYR
jgi:V/A-type H+-transporting ATPase subunit A